MTKFIIFIIPLCFFFFFFFFFLQYTFNLSNSGTLQSCITTVFKASIFLKIRHFIIQERFNKLIYVHKMWHLTACKISVCLSFLNWIKNEMIFYRISELMLPTLTVSILYKSIAGRYRPVRVADGPITAAVDL